MKNTLSAHHAPVGKIFCDDYNLVVPEYQRQYAWTKDEAETLLDDLLSHLEQYNGVCDANMPPYFLGCVVLSKKPDDAHSEIVDGQQRLSTLTILLASLRDRIKVFCSDSATDVGRMVFDKGSSIRNVPPRFHLTMKKKDREFFKEYVQKEGGLAKLMGNTDSSFDESRNLIRSNARVYNTRLAEMSDKQAESVATLIASKCYLVLVESEDFSSAYKTFGVLNNRGRDLMDIDILKAELFGSIHETQRDECSDLWDEVEDRLGSQAMGALFGHIKTMETKVNQQGGLVDDFRSKVINRIQPPFDAADFIKNKLAPLSLVYNSILNSSYGAGMAERKDTREIKDGVNDALYWLNATGTEEWVPAALLAWESLKTDPVALERLVKGLERLTYSFLVCGTKVYQRGVRMSKVVTEIEQYPQDINKIMAALDLTPKEQNSTIDALGGDVYESIGKQKLSVILQRLSDIMSADKWVLKEGQGPKAISIEHVLPQNPEENSQWIQWIPEAGDRDEWTHKLGNLVLLNQGKNSSAGRKSFGEKKARYFKHGGSTAFPLTTDIQEVKVWDVEQISSRQAFLVEVLTKHWNLVQTATVTTKKRRGVFRFDESPVSVGELISWNKDSSITATVSVDETVILNGKALTLGEATKELMGNTGGRPVRYWSYKGKTLEDIYDECAST